MSICQAVLLRVNPLSFDKKRLFRRNAKKMNFTNTKKYAVLACFLVAAILSVMFMGKVAINYNMSDYLDEETETRISLAIINEEFSATSNVQVMISDIDVDTAKSVRDTLAAIPNVLTVSFDPYSENSYKDGNALFVILVDGDEYSAAGSAVVEDIKTALDIVFEGKIQYGGAIVEKASLRNAIIKEIPFILAISVCLAIAIMLLTSKSWIEPLVLLAASGVAILLNMGSNAIFGEISYITNAVSSILQLALSVDYSIVLLHSYRTMKTKEADRGVAMGMAIKEVVKPVSASALTTVAGLLALLFMSFKIGFDIGIVLMKGIVISAITSLTLFPAFLLIFDKLMEKTKKRELVLKGRKFCGFSFRAGKFVAPIALLLVVACAFIQTSNVYTFTDSKNANATILDTFGQNNTVVVVYPNHENNHEYEKALANKLGAYQTADGRHVLKSYTAFSNTVRELYDMELATRKLSLPVKDVELLFTMYHLYGDPSRLEMKTLAFMQYADRLLTEDVDAQGFADAGTLKTVQTMLAIHQIMNSDLTADEFHTLVTTGAMEGTNLDLFSIKQMYGLYFYDQIEEQKVDFATMLDFVISISEKPETADMFDAETVEDLKTLSNGLDQLNSMLETPLSQEEFCSFINDNYGMAINDLTARYIYSKYHHATHGSVAQAPVALLDMLPFLIEQGYVTDAAAINAVEIYISAYYAVNASYSYEEFLPVLVQTVEALTGEKIDLDTSDLAIQQVYIMYFYEQKNIPEDKIQGREFIDFVNVALETNDVIGGRLSADDKAKITDICLADEFLQDETSYDFEEMTSKIADLQNRVQSIASSAKLGSSKISGIYIKYAIAGEMDFSGAIEAIDLLNFVTANMDTNELLKLKMTDEKREMVASAQEAIVSAEELFVSENYSRMLVSVNLPSESEESARFVEFITASVKEIFGEDAHVAGEIMSTYDLQKAFADDNTFITVFTIISIFLIVMVIFRSLSLPVILVAIIQGAIWISMSTSLLTGPMFFMSYIVTTCILMGATIDYGILMSTNYVQYRSLFDKKTALYKSVEAAMPTIFTSGMILMICGFVIGFIASQTAISTVGVLLGKGTLISILMIVFVLPALLYLLDAFVLGLSMKSKAADIPVGADEAITLTDISLEDLRNDND